MGSALAYCDAGVVLVAAVLRQLGEIHRKQCQAFSLFIACKARRRGKIFYDRDLNRLKLGSCHEFEYRRRV